MSEGLASSSVGVASAVLLDLGLSLGRVEGVSVGEGEEVVEIHGGGIIRDSVSDGNSSELDVGLSSGVSLDDAVRERGDVDACVALTSNVELVVLVLGEVSEPLNQEVEGIIGGTGVVHVDVVRSDVGVGETDSSRALEVEHVGNTVPAVRVLDKGGSISLRPHPGTVLVQETVQRRAARTSVQPSCHKKQEVSVGWKRKLVERSYAKGLGQRGSDRSLLLPISKERSAKRLDSCHPVQKGR